MTSAEIRQSFLDFFRSKQHTLVPSSSLLPDSPNLLFTNAGMNQFVPIFLGQQKSDVSKWPGAVPALDTRAADTQKCIRAGGKHNDLDDVGLDTYHLTFFEMLGNWSFGDYFKPESLAWGWELLTKVWGIPAKRLFATVYAPDKSKGDPAEFDQEAYEIWVGLFRSAGLDPAVHIVNGGKKDNFWMMGDTGPCGPCSEIHFNLQLSDDEQAGRALVNAGSQGCIEIWNHVFIQFNANPDGTFSPLPAKHVDTGMGFERVAGFYAGTKGFQDFSNVPSAYNADVFTDLFGALERLSGKKYAATLPGTAGGARASRPPPPASPPAGPAPGSVNTDVSGAGGVLSVQAAARDAQQSDRDGRGPRETPGATYHKRRLPHFERPWAKYMVSFSTHEHRQLSPGARDVVLDSLLFGHEQRRYQLYSACVMPDHVHFLFEPQIKEQDQQAKPVFWSVTDILQSIKSFTAHEVNKLEKKSGRLWENESFDRMIRGDADLEEKFHYICRNPWESGVVPPTENYPWLWTPELEGGARASRPHPSASSPAESAPEAVNADTSLAEGATTLVQAAARDARQSDRDGRGPQGQDDRDRGPHSAEQVQIDIAFRVIADHIRTLSFAIADGILPGNTDRNYVLRRILRRAVRYGRTLGFHEPFFYKLVDVLVDTMGHAFPEIREKRKHVQDVIRGEEEAFNRTLDVGIRRFNEICLGAIADSISSSSEGHMKAAAAELDFLDRHSSKAFSEIVHAAEALVPNWSLSVVGPIRGQSAFDLYDTYGFPLDLTELMARERGLTMDVEGFNKLMEEQRARARAAQKKEVIELSQIETTTPTKFIGYDKLEAPARVIEVVSVKDKTAIILDSSVCYAEMGGQVGDTGELGHGGQLWRILNTQKSGNTWLHFIEEGSAGVPPAFVGVPPTKSVRAPQTTATGSTLALQAAARDAQQSDRDGRGPQDTEAPRDTASLLLPSSGMEVTLTVDRDRRNAIQRHHTVTHLFHWALHEVVSRDAAQKGSYVGPEKLTFDFNSAPLTPQQVADIEKLVNERILENAGVSWIEAAHADVKARKDVLQFFGEKYGDIVRVVQIGGRAGELNGYSMELCGGTHTRATGEIGLFRIVSESAIAAGVRRIEAVAGLEAYRKANEELQLIKTLAGKVNSPAAELEKKIEALLAHQKELEKQVKTARQRNASNAAGELLGRAQTVNGIPSITHNLGDADGDLLQTIADALKGRFKGVVVLGGCANNAVSLVATVSPEFTSRVQAGKIIQTIAPIVGGKGGGKPDNARGGGKDVTKLEEALAKATALLG